MRHIWTIPAGLLALALAVAVALRSDPACLCDDGDQKMRSGETAAALECFERALAELDGDSSDPQYRRASLGAVEARVWLHPNRGASDFLEFARENPSAVTDRDFVQTGGVLAMQRDFDLAIQVLERGLVAFPDSPRLRSALRSVADLAWFADHPDAPRPPAISCDFSG